jgi:hypothetical protein
MDGLKLLERDSFREFALPVDGHRPDVKLGATVMLNGECWRIVGIASNPNRPGDHLVFVDRDAPSMETVAA